MPSQLAANIVDAAALADELARHKVVDADRLTELLAAFAGGGPVELAEYLVARGALNAFQAERALAGEARLLALGPYRLTGTAGRGTFGPLFAATHLTKPGEFALRVLPLRSLWRAKQAKQLARTLAAGVKHPAVAPLVDADSANGFHYLVWPATDAQRLTDRVAAAGPLSPGAAAGLLGHLLAAVAACHARKATHGAITPNSVALAPGGLPRLLELGAGALLAQNVAEDESLFDTMSAALASADVLTFAAPELAENPGELTAAADQYALGALGYFALTGLPPYPHPMLPEQLRAKRAGAPPSAAVVNPEVPEELAAVLERMMAPSPADRFAALAEVEARLAAISFPEAPPLSEPVPEVSLSQLDHARRSSGSISWARQQSGSVRPPERDDSDASVTFELPDAPETVPEAPAGAPGPPAASRGSAETPPGFAFFTPPPERAPAPTDTPRPPTPEPQPQPPAPLPVLWHAASPDSSGAMAPAQGEGAPPNASVLWKKVRRNLMFWQAAADTLQVSVFGPPATPGRTVKLLVFLHTPDAADNVRTLSRAFLEGAELIGTGFASQDVPRGSELAVHLSVANAGVAKALLKMQWRGQPQRLGFDLHVPWESPEGVSPGLVSVGLKNVRIGKIEFGLNVLPRKA